MFENKYTKQINEGTQMIQENNNNKTKTFISMKREKKQTIIEEKSLTNEEKTPNSRLVKWFIDSLSDENRTR